MHGKMADAIVWLVAWLFAFKIELAILESTGIYWKSVFTHLEAADSPTWVADAHYVKRVPGRKTDVADSEWLAQLGRFGLVRSSFIPSKNSRELRLVSRYRKNSQGFWPVRRTTCANFSMMPGSSSAVSFSTSRGSRPGA